MSVELDLQEIERKVWRTFHDDGLLDLYLGLLLLAMGIGAKLSDAGASKLVYYGIYLGMILLAMLLFWAGKRLITRPRVGVVKYGAKGKSRRRKAILVSGVSVLAGLLLWGLSNWADQGLVPATVNRSIFATVFWAVNALLVFGLMAVFLEANRLFVVAVMYAIAVPLDTLVGQWTGYKLGWLAFVLPAVVILIMGAVAFIQFLQKYPMREVESGANLRD